MNCRNRTRRGRRRRHNNNNNNNTTTPLGKGRGRGPRGRGLISGILVACGIGLACLWFGCRKCYKCCRNWNDHDNDVAFRSRNCGGVVVLNPYCENASRDITPNVDEVPQREISVIMNERKGASCLSDVRTFTTTQQNEPATNRSSDYVRDSPTNRNSDYVSDGIAMNRMNRSSDYVSDSPPPRYLDLYPDTSYH